MTFDSIVNRIQISDRRIEITFVVFQSNPERFMKNGDDVFFCFRSYLTTALASVRSASLLLFIACLRISLVNRSISRSLSLEKEKNSMQIHVENSYGQFVGSIEFFLVESVS